MEQCRLDALACRDDYVPPEEEPGVGEEGLQRMDEDENEKTNEDGDEDDDDAYNAPEEGEGADGGERVTIEGYEDDEGHDAEEKDDEPYDYGENQQQEEAEE